MLSCVDAMMCGFVFAGVDGEGGGFTAAAVDA
jgi:hypothetical protein